jgi:predicted XRE-type DNA-binding protein
MDDGTLEDVAITEGSGNVFADLGLPRPAERLLKAQLALEIDRFIQAKGWTQAEAARSIGITQPEVSNMLRGRLAGFSVDRLLTIVNKLGHTVEVRILAEEQAPEETELRVRVA